MRQNDMSWNDAFLKGHRIVIKAMRPNEGGEKDIALARICGKAILLDIDEGLIAKCMREKSEDYLKNLIHQRTH